jgi:sugar O-acyltransferase (sialic acid O-acetyltransferase NeuD family)
MIDDAGNASRPLLIFPCNGNGLEAADCLGEEWRLAAIVDDRPDKQGKRVAGVQILGRQALFDWPDAAVLAVPGSPASFRDRRAIIQGLGVADSRFATVIHPSASVGPRVTIGQNVFIMAGTVITSNAVVGNHVCVLANSVIHHDTSVGDWSLIGSGVTIAGGCVLEENCYVGSGSSIREGTVIGAGALVGMGSTVIKDVPPGATVAGCPAEPLE